MIKSILFHKIMIEFSSRFVNYNYKRSKKTIYKYIILLMVFYLKLYNSERINAFINIDFFCDFSKD